MTGRAGIFVLVLLSHSTFAWSQNSVVPAARIDQKLLEIRNRNGVPGLGALLFQNSKAVSASVVGLRKVGDPTPIGLADAFHLGSDTKAMTATLVGILVDEGLLTWTSTLKDLLTDIPNLHPDFQNVTLEMLLAHRSGLATQLTPELQKLIWKPGLDPLLGRRLVSAELLSRSPSREPGSEFIYSNSNYVVVGHILELVSGTRWEVLMQNRLFRSLRMDSCGFGPGANPALPLANAPWGHLETANGLQPIHRDNPSTLGPAGTVHCSLLDWQKFVSLHLNAENGRAQLLRPETFRKLHTPYPGQDYTYGAWKKIERPWANGPVFVHDGSNTFNYATAWWAPGRNLSILAVTNVGGPKGQAATMEAVSLMLSRAR